MSYIYQIRNVNNGRRYIGQTDGLSHRRSCHRYDLRHGRHKSELMQTDYDADSKCLVFEVLCQCNKEEANDLEAYFIKKYDTVKNGYNKALGVTESGGMLFSEEMCDAVSERQTGNTAMVGRKLSDEWKRHLSEAQPHRKRIRCVDTGEEFESFADAARKTGLNRTKIVSVCTGHRKSTGGMRFEYAEQ